LTNRRLHKMDTLIQKLGNNESVLLMYLAGELPDGDRAEVEQLLANDAGMRAELERIRLAWDGITENLRAIDASSPLMVGEGKATANVARLMRQWQVERLVKQQKEPAAPADRLRFPWWSYPTAAAACVLMAFLVWWGNSPLPPTETAAVDRRSEMFDPVQNEQAAQFAEAIDRTFEFPIYAENSQSLRSVGDEVSALSKEGESDFWVDANNN
jgi:anti-sigma factor RsiW